MRIMNEELDDMISIRARGRGKSVYLKIGLLNDGYHASCTEVRLDPEDVEKFKEVLSVALIEYERRKALPTDEDE